jgi:hypothetical protein
MLASHTIAAEPVNTATIFPEAGDPHQAYTKERFEKYMAQLAKTPKPIDLIFDGDSITDGWQNAGKKLWEENWARRQAFDFGISGDRTQHVLWRLNQALSGSLRDI